MTGQDIYVECSVVSLTSCKSHRWVFKILFPPESELKMQMRKGKEEEKQAIRSHSVEETRVIGPFSHATHSQARVGRMGGRADRPRLSKHTLCLPSSPPQARLFASPSLILGAAFGMDGRSVESAPPGIRGARTVSLSLRGRDGECHNHDKPIGIAWNPVWPDNVRWKG